MSSAELRVACVGAGYFSQFHYESWARMEGVMLVGACDHDLERAHSTGLPAFTDMAQMLDQTLPDIVDIILPPAAQASAIRAALEARPKAIICQKPFCNDLDTARRITQEADAAGVALVIHENFRHQPWYRAMKAVMEGDEIGTPLQLSFRLRPGDGQGPQAYLDRQPYFRDMPRFLIHETGVHWVDTFRYLMGDPVAVYADLRRLNTVIAGEDAGMVIFEYPHGMRAFLDGNRHLDHDSDNLRRTMGTGLVEGTRGSLELSGDGSVVLREFASRARREVLGPDTHQGFGGDCVHAFQTHVIAALTGAGAFETPATEYLKVLEVEAAIYQSTEERRRIILDPR